MNKARITYRFNPHHPHPKKLEGNEEKGQIIHLNEDEFNIKESPKVELEKTFYDHQPLNQFTTDFGTWSSPIDLETMKLEKLIRETNGSKVNTTTQRNPQLKSNSRYEAGYYEEPEHQQPSFEHIQWYDLAESKSHYNTSTKAPWFKIISSITGAVVTGVVFGYLVLTLFSNDTGKITSGNGAAATADPAAFITNEPAAQNESSQTQGVTEQNSTTSPALQADNSISVNILAQSFFVLQNGVFATLEGAKAAQLKLDEQGFAAQAEVSDKYYVYAGVTTNKDDASLLGYRLKENAMEVFVKPYDIPMIKQIKWSGKQPEDVNSYFIQANKLLQLICGLTTVHLEELKLTPLDSGIVQTVKKEHQAWTGLVTTVSEGMPENEKANFQKMNNAMNTAVMSLDAYNKNLSTGQLWQAQKSLMEYITTEKELLTSIAVQ